MCIQESPSSSREMGSSRHLKSHPWRGEEKKKRGGIKERDLTHRPVRIYSCWKQLEPPAWGMWLQILLAPALSRSQAPPAETLKQFKHDHPPCFCSSSLDLFYFFVSLISFFFFFLSSPPCPVLLWLLCSRRAPGVGGRGQASPPPCVPCKGESRLISGAEPALGM